MRFIILIFSFLLLNFANKNHPIHISVANVEYIPAEQEVQFTVRFFTDDFNLNLTKNYGKDFKIGTSDEMSDANLYISDYLSKHLTFAVAQNTFHPKFEIEKKEFNSEENTMTVFVRFGARLKDKLTIRNTLMADLYSDQKNLLIFTVGNNQMPYKFDADDTTADFVF